MSANNIPKVPDYETITDVLWRKYDAYGKELS